MSEVGAWMVILAVGLATFFMRWIFLAHPPKWVESPRLREALDSIPSSMLIALVLPFALFIDGSFDPFRWEVAAILLTIPIVIVANKPGLSLPVALTLLLLLLAIF